MNIICVLLFRTGALDYSIWNIPFKSSWCHWGHFWKSEWMILLIWPINLVQNFMLIRQSWCLSYFVQWRVWRIKVMGLSCFENYLENSILGGQMFGFGNGRQRYWCHILSKYHELTLKILNGSNFGKILVEKEMGFVKLLEERK